MQVNTRKDYFWNTLGVLAQNAISPLLVIAITRINGIYDSGIFSFAFSVALIFWMFGLWGGRTYQVSDIRSDFANQSYMILRFGLAFTMIIGAVIFLIINHYSEREAGVIIALVMFKSVEAIADAFHAILQRNNRLFNVGKSLMYKSAAGFLTFLFIDIATKSIILGSLGIVLVNIIIFFIYDLRIVKRVDDISIHSHQLQPYIKKAVSVLINSAPVFGVLFMALFALNIPRYFVDHYYKDQIGYFGILAMPMTLIVLLMTFVIQPKVVQLTKLYDQQKLEDFNDIVKHSSYITATIGFIILSLAFFIGVPALQLVFGVSFAGYKLSLMIMIAGGTLNAIATILINVLIIARHFIGQFYALLTTNIVLALLSSIIVKRHGLVGGVSLFAATTLCQLLILFYVYRRILMGNGTPASKIIE